MYEMKGIRCAEGLFKFLLATAMAWLGCIALVSCDQGDTNAGEAEAHITLTLCLKGTDTDNYTRTGQSGGKQIASRSEDSETDEPGTEMENSIDLSRFHVVFYDANQQMAGILQNMVLVHLGGNIYRLTGSLPVSNKVLVGNHFEGKMVVYANFDMSEDLQKAYNDQGIAQKSFAYEANPKYLPMWGVKKVSFTLTAGKRQDFSDIDLLRAVAKVKVNLSNDMKKNGWSIRSMRLINYNGKGYCMPSKYAECEQTASLTHEEFEHFLESKQTGGITMTDNVPIYLPEYKNNGKENADKCVIKLKLARKGNVEVDEGSGEEKEYTLRFIDYTDKGTEGTTTNDIVRDHYYTFEVYKGSNGQNLVKLTVRKWNVRDHEEIVM